MTDAPFQQISPNPYIVGNPVRGRTMFFGREAEFNLVRKRFEHSDQGGLFVFCGERRSGKTSILFQILDLRLGPAFIPVLIDMQSMAIGSEAEFLARLSEEILAAMGQAERVVTPPDFAQEPNRSAAFQRFVQACLRAQPGRKLILLFDEYELFENKIESGLLAEDVLYVLAGLMERASVFMIFTGSQYLEQRRREYWKILGKSIYKTVSYLERDDAVSLIRQPVEGRASYDDGAVEAIIRLTAGQPFYTQAICQGLVDQLNDRQTRQVEAPLVAEIVDALINNPLPQMIFLWDGLEPDDKLVLALLAETLEGPDAFAGVDALIKRIKKRDYPIDLDRPRIATALEKLFKSEMLLRDDRATEPVYAFRMDLWRRWIARQHSVWQAMRELGLAIRKPRAGLVRRVAPVLGGIGAIALAVLLFRPKHATETGGSLAGVARGFLALDVEPAEAGIRMDGQRIGMGGVHDSIAAGVDHRLDASAPGYADSAVTARVEGGRALAMRLRLRALLGDVRVETVPPGAEVRVDGAVVGTSPVVLRGLTVARPHHVEASRAGFGMARADVSVASGVQGVTRLTLEQGRSDLLVTTEPAECQVRLDGAARGPSPLTLPGLTLGRHTVSASSDGYQSADTALVVSADTRRLHLTLRREPPGVLVVQGDLPAQIYVDGALVVENVQNSGPRTLSPGNHSVRVVLVSGETIDHAVAVHSAERATYDFTRNTVTRKPDGGR